MGMLQTVQSTRHRRCRSPFTSEVALQRLLSGGEVTMPSIRKTCEDARGGKPPSDGSRRNERLRPPCIMSPLRSTAPESYRRHSLSAYGRNTPISITSNSYHALNRIGVNPNEFLSTPAPCNIRVTPTSRKTCVRVAVCRLNGSATRSPHETLSTLPVCGNGIWRMLYRIYAPTRTAHDLFIPLNSTHSP